MQKKQAGDTIGIGVSVASGVIMNSMCYRCSGFSWDRHELKLHMILKVPYGQMHDTWFPFIFVCSAVLLIPISKLY